MAWSAALLDKDIKTDGSMTLFVQYVNGPRTINKQYTFFGNFDLPQVVANEISNFESLRQEFISTPLGAITPAPAVTATPTQVEQANFFTNLAKLKQYQTLIDLGVATADTTFNNLKSSVISGFNASYL